MSFLLQDIRYGIRMLVKNRGVTLLAVLALAIGIGANSSIFSLVSSILLSPFPFPHTERLMRVYQVHEERGSINDSISGANYLDVKEQCKSFETFSLVTVNFYNFVGGKGEPERLPAYVMSPNICTINGMTPQFGRGFLPDEDQTGKDHVVLLTHGLWMERFGGDPQILGKTVQLDNIPYTVIGVLSSNLGFLEGEAKLWVPLPKEEIGQERTTHGQYASIACLKEGVTEQQAQAELDTIADQLAVAYPESNAKWGLHIEPIVDRILRFMKQTFIVLHGVVGFVLLIACSIVASLLLARANSRQKEIAIRSALGASRIRIIRQVLTESVLLALVGGAAGLLITLWGIDAIGSLLPSELSSLLLRAGLDKTVLTFTVLVCVAAGILFGFAPALQVSRTDLRGTLNEGGRSAGFQSGGHRMLRALVVGEIAFSLILLIGAGLMVNSFVHLQHVKPGFDTSRLMTCHVFLPESKYKEPEKKRVFYRDVVQRVANIPGHKGLAVTSVIPMTWGEGIVYEIEDKPAVSSEESKFAQIRGVNPDYFQVMNILLMKGRVFTHEDESETCYKIVINDKLARELDGDPIGQFIRLPEWEGKSYEVIGVVGNMKQFGLKSEYSPEIYTTYLHRPARHICFAMRTPGDPHRFASLIRREIRALDSDLPVNRMKTMDELIDDSMVMDRFGMTLMSLFSVVALILSSLGIYGIMAYSTSQRTHEIGVRIAIGAQVGDVVKLVVSQGLRLTLIGVGLGLAGSFLITRYLSSSLFGISATDPITYINVSLFLIVVSMFACYLPARRAAKVDPLIVLRGE